VHRLTSHDLRLTAAILAQSLRIQRECVRAGTCSKISAKRSRRRCAIARLQLIRPISCAANRATHGARRSANPLTLFVRCPRTLSVVQQCISVLCGDRRAVARSFGFPLQFPLSLMIELLISALRFSGLLPKSIGAANNIHSGGLFHLWTFSYSQPNEAAYSVRAANANSPISEPRATTMIARKNLLMPGNARIAVSFERRFPLVRQSVTLQTSGTVRT
jgi:hypothetical protein